MPVMHSPDERDRRLAVEWLASETVTAQEDHE